MAGSPRSRPGKRHHAVVRVTHWINVLALTIMVGSGLRIFNAYPGFAPRGGSFCCYPFEGQAFPDWLTFGGWLAGARNWHFAMMWVLVINGLVYLGWVYLHGEWRDLVPRKGDPRDVAQMLRFYLRLRSDHPRQGKHNALQKLSYFTIPMIAAVAVVSGIAIWKPVTLGWLTALLGGYVWARYWHFLAMLALVAFTAVHVFMVFAVDPYSMRSMVSGRYDERRSPEARNARPFTRSSPRAEARPGPRPESAPAPEPAAGLAPASGSEAGPEVEPEREAAAETGPGPDRGPDAGPSEEPETSPSDEERS